MSRKLSQENLALAKYEITDADRETIEAVLAMAQRVVDLQYDQAVEEELQNLLLDVADMFSIETHSMVVTEKEDGTITVTAISDEQTTKMNKNSLGWTPRIISNDDDKPEED